MNKKIFSFLMASFCIGQLSVAMTDDLLEEYCSTRHDFNFALRRLHELESDLCCPESIRHEQRVRMQEFFQKQSILRRQLERACNGSVKKREDMELRLERIERNWRQAELMAQDPEVKREALGAFAPVKKGRIELADVERAYILLQRRDRMVNS